MQKSNNLIIPSKIQLCHNHRTQNHKIHHNGCSIQKDTLCHNRDSNEDKQDIYADNDEARDKNKSILQQQFGVIHSN
jgi:hypothetical protein